LANTAQARKRARQVAKHRARNFALRSKVRTSIKEVLQATARQDKGAAQAAYREAVSVIDQVVSKGVLHANAAARHKSRLSARIRALG
jgi:small subunit ribosomal protein S20